MSWRRSLAWAMGAVGVAMAIASSVVFPPSGGFAPDLGGPGGAIPVVVSLAYAMVGGLIIHRHPTHLVGWLLIWFVLSFGAGVYLDEYAYHEPSLSGRRWVAWWSGFGFITGLVPLVTLLPLSFPTGRPLSRWRNLVPVILGGILLLVSITALDPDLLTDLGYANPMGVRALRPVVEPLTLLGIFLTGVGLVGALASAVDRFRSARGDEHQQMKWFLLGVFLTALAVITDAIVYFVFDRLALALVIVSLGSLALPLSIGIAILRYRLYDIDLVINRTLVYGALTGFLGLVYVGAVVGLSQLVPGEDNDPAVAAATLAVAALFSPARRRIQAFVDRRFYRSRYDARRTLEAFGSRLREEVELETLLSDLQAVVQDTLHPSSVGVWVRREDG